jgi:serine/threonine protein kinase
LSDPPDDAWLIALGTELSDGAAVDWDLAAGHAPSDEARSLVDNLKRLESVIHGHRTAGSEPAAASPDPGASSARHWRQFVLFESVGAGAFGTVYRAWDTKVDREVALKLLSAGRSSTRSPLSEARHLARIRHPNIVTVYGAEQDQEVVGIWMEFIQGETLAAMIRDRGPMSAREVVGIGIDLCRALSALQGASLLHRDIKAHNVMREVGGRIVLMDFSGAWTSEPGQAPENVSGTPIYMAPELFADRPASAASDIYSLGVLLFYLLSGRMPVEGATVEEIKSAHARGARTRLRDLRPELPESVVQVVERAAAHDAPARYQTAGELEHALAGTMGAHALPSYSEDAAAPGSKGRRRDLKAPVMWAAIAVAAVALTALLLTVLRSAPVEATLVRFTIGPPDNTGSWPRISPDGRLVVYGTAVEGLNLFWVKPLDAADGRPIPNTSNKETPFWSPDSRFLAFFDRGKLKKIDVTGRGQPQTLADTLQTRGGDWNRDDTLIFATETGLSRIKADGSQLTAVTTLDKAHGEFAHGWPEFLPDGQRFFYVVRSSQPEHAGIYLGSLASQARKRILPAFSRAAYAGGYLLFARDGALMAQRFDQRTETLSGEAETVAVMVKQHAGSDAAFDVSDNGVLIYRCEEGNPLTRLVLFDRNGEETRIVASSGTYRNPRFSPDGRRIVAERLEPDTLNADLWLFEHARGMAARFTTSDGPDIAPTWSPDGREIAFSSKRGSRYDVYTKTVDEITEEKRQPGPDGDNVVEDWSPDGKSILRSVIRNGLWHTPFDGQGQPSLIRPTTVLDRWLAEISPDGRWIAYTSYASGDAEVYVEPADRSGAQYQVSARGGLEPHWRDDGRELFYLTLDKVLVSVDVAASGTWHAGTERQLFRVATPGPTGSSNYHVTADGQTFVVNTILGYPPLPPIHVVVNWAGLLER